MKWERLYAEGKTVELEKGAAATVKQIRLVDGEQQSTSWRPHHALRHGGRPMSAHSYGNGCRNRRFAHVSTKVMTFALAGSTSPRVTPRRIPTTSSDSRPGHSNRAPDSRHASGSPDITRKRRKRFVRARLLSGRHSKIRACVAGRVCTRETLKERVGKYKD